MSRPVASLVLVEDSEPYARLVALVLEGAVPDIEVRRHATLAAAIADLRQRPAGCVLLDLSLPDCQGLEGIAVLRDAGVREPIVVLSGYDDEALAERAVRCGALHYLVKGEERERLLEILGDLFGSRR